MSPAPEKSTPATGGPANIVIEYTMTGEGVPEGGKKARLSQKEGTLDAKLLVPCANPECKKGGFLLRPHVDKAVKAGEPWVDLEIPCAGYTGALRSERGPAERCPNKLEARVKIAYSGSPPKGR
jgi:hypothetical protein